MAMNIILREFHPREESSASNHNRVLVFRAFLEHFHDFVEIVDSLELGKYSTHIICGAI